MTSELPKTAEAVVVGGGTVGAWGAYFLRGAGLAGRRARAAGGDAINPTMAPGCTLGATYCDEDGFITPPRNVAAYTAALVSSGVLVAERTRFCGLDPAGAAGSAGTVQTSRGSVSAGLVV